MNRIAPDYRTARARFLEACAAGGLAVASVCHPLRGPSGETIALDVARHGPAEAEAWLVVFSATHGTEGPFGSAVQRDLARRAAALPPGLALLLVHGLNPWGFAWNRRTTEDNVDLNRNWIDYTRPRPANPDYDRLAAALEPPSLDPESVAGCDAALAAFEAGHGTAALQSALSGGQYDHPDGLFFGGFGPTWSRRRLAETLSRHLAPARRVAIIDCHTGLGPPGHAELITAAAPGSAEYERARAWWGAGVTSTAGHGSVSSPLTGTLDDGVKALLPGTEVTFIAIEVGTQPLKAVLNRLRADGWLHRHGGFDTAGAKSLKAALRDCFAPPEPGWAAAALDQARQTIDAAIAALAHRPG